MPLALDDPRWNELQGSYGDTSDVVAWLTEAQRDGGLSDERLGDLINEVTHQGDCSTAMHVVAGHLISLAQSANPETALRLLTHAGLIYAESDHPRAVPCPDFLKEEFATSAPKAARALAQLLPLATEFYTYKYAVAALAGYLGHQSFGRFLDGLDLHKGEFYHSLLEKPFPPEI